MLRPMFSTRPIMLRPRVRMILKQKDDIRGKGRVRHIFRLKNYGLGLRLIAHPANCNNPFIVVKSYGYG